MNIVGIDLGSRAVKVVLFKDKQLNKKLIYDTASFYRNYCSNNQGQLTVDFERLGLQHIEKVISTGYGRNNVNIQNSEVILELKAHVFGAIWQTGLENFTLLDIGGQDSKVIQIKSKRMIDMFLNDKCAASCGRYLENMANVLGININELEKYSEEPVLINSTCAVFSESELIGKISEGNLVEKLAAGVNYSLYKRIKPSLDRFPNETLVISGGVAKNNAIVKYISSEMSYTSIIVPKEPQFNGAIGCVAYYLVK